MGDPDSQLLALARAGDQEAAGRLAAGLSLYCYRLARRLARRYRCGIDPEDLVQAGVIAVWRAVPSFDPARSRWRHHAFSVARKAMAKAAFQEYRRQRHTAQHDDRHLSATNANHHPVSSRAARLRAALDALDPVTRAVWESYWGQARKGRRLGPIARRLGITRGRAMRILAAGHRQVLAALDPGGEVGG